MKIEEICIGWVVKVRNLIRNPVGVDLVLMGVCLGVFIISKVDTRFTIHV
ncbi:hypothetical protein Hanom_Chr13g01209251 [Helianthus anomalus]